MTTSPLPSLSAVLDEADAGSEADAAILNERFVKMDCPALVPCRSAHCQQSTRVILYFHGRAKATAAIY